MAGCPRCGILEAAAAQDLLRAQAAWRLLLMSGRWQQSASAHYDYLLLHGECAVYWR